MTKNENSWDVPIRFLDDEILRLENLQRLDVAKARAEGCSWDSIGRVFGFDWRCEAKARDERCVLVRRSIAPCVARLIWSQFRISPLLLCVFGAKKPARSSSPGFRTVRAGFLNQLCL
jgi:hypothetical protein